MLVPSALVQWTGKVRILAKPLAPALILIRQNTNRRRQIVACKRSFNHSLLYSSGFGIALVASFLYIMVMRLVCESARYQNI